MMFCRKRRTQNRQKLLKRFKVFKSLTWFLLLCISVLLLIGCDTDETVTPPVRHTLEFSELSLTNQTLDPGGTATVTATFNYSGDEADLIFRWEASSGQIVGDTSTATYVASEAAGTHTITLALTDGFTMAERSITVEVGVLQSLLIDSDTYWAGQDETLALKYQVNVTEILHQPVTLRYAILQDEDKTGAFLSVQVNGDLIVEEEAIGEVRPFERIPITKKIDVSGVITGPGTYEVTLTLVVINAVEHGWLLQKAELIGAEGFAVRL